MGGGRRTAEGAKVGIPHDVWGEVGVGRCREAPGDHLDHRHDGGGERDLQGWGTGGGVQEWGRRARSAGVRTEYVGQGRGQAGAERGSGKCKELSRSSPFYFFKTGFDTGRGV